METTTAHQLKLSCVKTLHDNWNPLIQKLNFSDVAMHSDRRLLRSRNNPWASSQSVPRDSTAIGNNVCWAARLLLFGRLAWRCHFCCSTCLARWWVQVSYIHLYSLYSILLLFPSPGQILVYKRCNLPPWGGWGGVLAVDGIGSISNTKVCTKVMPGGFCQTWNRATCL